MECFQWIAGGGQLLWELHLPGITYQTILLLLKHLGVLSGHSLLLEWKIASFRSACFVKIFCLINYSFTLLFFCWIIALRVFCYFVFCYFCLFKFKFYSIKLFRRLFVFFTYCFIYFFVLYIIFGWFYFMCPCAG